jgi:hypothetical protein
MIAGPQLLLVVSYASPRMGKHQPRYLHRPFKSLVLRPQGIECIQARSDLPDESGPRRSDMDRVGA